MSDIIGEVSMNADSIFIYYCPYGYKKLNLTIFGSNSGPDSGSYRQTEFLGNFHRG